MLHSFQSVPKLLYLFLQNSKFSVVLYLYSLFPIFLILTIIFYAVIQFHLLVIHFFSINFDDFCLFFFLIIFLDHFIPITDLFVINEILYQNLILQVFCIYKIGGQLHKILKEWFNFYRQVFSIRYWATHLIWYLRILNCLLVKYFMCISFLKHYLQLNLHSNSYKLVLTFYLLIIFKFI